MIAPESNPGQGIRVAVLCKEKDVSVFLLNNLRRHFQVTSVVIEEEKPFRVLFRLLQRVRFDGIETVFWRLLFLLYYAAFEREMDRDDFRRTISNAGTPVDTWNPQAAYWNALRVSNINFPKVPNEVMSHNPDLILVLGTSILKCSWLHLPIPVLNIHYGLPEHYRGSFCGFWALLQKKWDLVGVCIHQIKEKVDAGEIFARESLDLEKVRKVKSMGELLAYQALLAWKLVHQLLTSWPLSQSIPSANSGKLFFIPGFPAFLRFKKGLKRK